MTVTEAAPETTPQGRIVPLSSKGVDVRREGVDGSRYYSDPINGTLLQSVTTVISATTSKPWLTQWAAKLAAQAAVENLDLVAAMVARGQEEEAVDYLKSAGKRKREEASERGTWVHDVVEAFALDTSLPEIGDDDAPYADAFVEWCIEWQPVFLGSECSVAHPGYGYAGTLDLLVRFPCFDGTPYEGTWLLDAKSGANLDAYMPVQLKAYKEATEVWLPQGRKTRMPHVDHVGVLHIRPGGCKLLDVTDQADELAFHTFLRMLELLSWKDAQGGRMGKALYLPDADGNQPPPLLEDLDGVPARSALAAAGVHRLDQLESKPADELAGLSGVGPGALRAVRDLLASHKRPIRPDLLAMLEELEAKDAAKRDRAELKHAQQHLPELLDGVDRCQHEGILPGSTCGRTSAEHDKPAPKKRASTRKPKAAAAAMTTEEV